MYVSHYHRCAFGRQRVDPPIEEDDSDIQFDIREDFEIRQGENRVISIYSDGWNRGWVDLEYIGPLWEAHCWSTPLKDFINTGWETIVDHFHGDVGWMVPLLLEGEAHYLPQLVQRAMEEISSVVLSLGRGVFSLLRYPHKRVKDIPEVSKTAMITIDTPCSPCTAKDYFFVVRSNFLGDNLRFSFAGWSNKWVIPIYTTHQLYTATQGMVEKPGEEGITQTEVAVIAGEMKRQVVTHGGKVLMKGDFVIVMSVKDPVRVCVGSPSEEIVAHIDRRDVKIFPSRLRFNGMSVSIRFLRVETEYGGEVHRALQRLACPRLAVPDNYSGWA